MKITRFEARPDIRKDRLKGADGARPRRCRTGITVQSGNADRLEFPLVDVSGKGEQHIGVAEQRRDRLYPSSQGPHQPIPMQARQMLTAFSQTVATSPALMPMTRKIRKRRRRKNPLFLVFRIMGLLFCYEVSNDKVSSIYRIQREAI